MQKRRIGSAKMAGTTARRMKAVVKMNTPLLRYRPHWRKLPAPKAYDVRVSCAVFMPISSASIITELNEPARPTTATLTGSGMRAAKKTIVTLHRKDRNPVIIDGMASLAKVLTIQPVVGAMVFGSKKFKLSSFSSSNNYWRVDSFDSFTFILILTRVD